MANLKSKWWQWEGWWKWWGKKEQRYWRSKGSFSCRRVLIVVSLLCCLILCEGFSFFLFPLFFFLSFWLLFYLWMWRYQIKAFLTWWKRVKSFAERQLPCASLGGQQLFKIVQKGRKISVSFFFFSSLSPFSSHSFLFSSSFTYSSSAVLFFASTIIAKYNIISSFIYFPFQFLFLFLLAIFWLFLHITNIYLFFLLVGFLYRTSPKKKKEKKTVRYVGWAKGKKRKMKEGKDKKKQAGGGRKRRRRAERDISW